jgi:ferredoxin-fold anticodon binding domain-containing protein
LPELLNKEGINMVTKCCNCNTPVNSSTAAGNTMMPPIKYNGVSQELPEHPKYFTQIAIPETLVIPEQKPDIEQIVSVTVDTAIESLRIVDTPCMKSFEGQSLSGKKLIVELRLIEKVVYVANEPTQSVHAAHFQDTYKSIFVVVPQTVNEETIDDLFLHGKLIVTPYIEDIYAELTDARTIFKNITMLLDVTIACNC